ncbi:hypothetical protein TNCV_4302571 [Trichonephila clavipes]|nr:hypothetical protein TNCV_4302571 [Trichonephila clavipes]
MASRFGEISLWSSSEAFIQLNCNFKQRFCSLTKEEDHNRYAKNSKSGSGRALNLQTTGSKFTSKQRFSNCGANFSSTSCVQHPFIAKQSPPRVASLSYGGGGSGKS